MAIKNVALLCAVNILILIALVINIAFAGALLAVLFPSAIILIFLAILSAIFTGIAYMVNIVKAIFSGDMA